MGNIARQPVFQIVYGPIGSGKTTDLLMSYPRAFFVAAPGALKASIGVAGFEPPDASVRDFESIPAITEFVTKGLKPGAFDALVVDDFSLYVQRQIVKMQNSGVGGFDLWGAIFRFTLMLREACRTCGMHAAFSMHELPPREEKGVRLPGCPALPGQKLPYDVPAAADLVLRAVPALPVGDVLGFPNRYACDATSAAYRTKDRHNVTPDMAPMNTREILGLISRESRGMAPANFVPRRAPGLEWQEDLVEKAATAILAKTPGKLDVGFAQKVGKALFDAALKRSPDERHALWTVRDAWDRAVLRHALSGHRRKFFGF